MKKLILMITCLFTLAVNTEAQIATEDFEDFYDSLAIETPSYHNTISIKKIDQNYFELVRYCIGEGFFGNKILERSVRLYKGDIDSMIDFFDYILNKSKEWNEICVQNESPWVNKQIIGCSVKIDKKNKNYKQLKDWNDKYNVEFGYTGKGNFIVVFDKSVLDISRPSFYKENDLECILEYIKNFKASNYYKECSKEEKKRKNVLDMLN